MNKLFICQTFHWDLGLLSRPKYIYVWQVALSSTTCTWIKNTLRYKYEIICFIFSLTSDSTTFLFIFYLKGKCHGLNKLAWKFKW